MFKITKNAFNCLLVNHREISFELSKCFYLVCDFTRCKRKALKLSNSSTNILFRD